MTVLFNRYGLEFEEMAAAIEGAIVETATIIEQDVKGKAPVSTAGASAHAGALSAPVVTGNLRRSYHQDRANLKDPLEPSIEIGNDPGIAEYGIYVEYGTYKMAPRPHLTPSSESQTGPHALRVAAALGVAAGRGYGSTLSALAASGPDAASRHPLLGG